ncbi:MAG: hypothetical protein Q8S00_21425 [Deltaproteobacteria bacterium]|nr:hypothetical protein [Deltaproteobacteria bacterium]MDZ4341717.1 hypothetical protein [Candidatus Binatia bacterium]
MENEEQATSDLEISEEHRPVEKADSNLAIIITLAALLLWFGFQSVQLWRERGNLSAVKASQETALQESEKIRLQFQGLMAKTSELANQGNAGAKLIVDELQKRGIGVPPPGAKPAEKLEFKPAK